MIIYVLGLIAAALAAITAAYIYYTKQIGPHIRAPIRCIAIHNITIKRSAISASDITIEQLVMLLDECVEAGIRFVGPVEWLDSSDSRVWLLTCDDAFESFGERAFPILESRNIPCLVFVVDGYIGTTPDWDYRSGSRRHLTKDALHAMVDTGLVELGCHSRTHPDLRKIRNSQVADEVSLQDGRDYFSYPFGCIDRNLIGRVAEAGYSAAFGTLNGDPELWGSKSAIPRMPLNAFDNRMSIRTKVRGGRLYWIEILKARIIGAFAPLTYQWKGRS